MAHWKNPVPFKKARLIALLGPPLRESSFQKGIQDSLGRLVFKGREITEPMPDNERDEGPGRWMVWDCVGSWDSPASAASGDVNEEPESERYCSAVNMQAAEGVDEWVLIRRCNMHRDLEN